MAGGKNWLIIIFDNNRQTNRASDYLYIYNKIYITSCSKQFNIVLLYI